MSTFPDRIHFAGRTFRVEDGNLYLVGDLTEETEGVRTIVGPVSEMGGVFSSNGASSTSMRFGAEGVGRCEVRSSSSGGGGGAVMSNVCVGSSDVHQYIGYVSPGLSASNVSVNSSGGSQSIGYVGHGPSLGRGSFRVPVGGAVYSTFEPRSGSRPAIHTQVFSGVNFSDESAERTGGAEGEAARKLRLRLMRRRAAERRRAAGLEHRRRMASAAEAGEEKDGPASDSEGRARPRHRPLPRQRSRSRSRDRRSGGGSGSGACRR